MIRIKEQDQLYQPTAALYAAAPVSGYGHADDVVSYAFDLPESIPATVKNGQKLGTATVYLDGYEVGQVDLVTHREYVSDFRTDIKATLLLLCALILILCALGFAVHILVVDHFVAVADGVRLSCIQFGVCGVLSLICMFLFESPDLGNILACWLPVLYGGLLSSGVGYTLQIVGQKGVNPAVASLILSLESVFSVLAGWVLMPGSSLSSWEILGCVIVFAAVLMVNLAPQGESEL